MNHANKMTWFITCSLMTFSKCSSEFLHSSLYQRWSLIIVIKSKCVCKCELCARRFYETCDCKKYAWNCIDLYKLPWNTMQELVHNLVVIRMLCKRTNTWRSLSMYHPLILTKWGKFNHLHKKMKERKKRIERKKSLSKKSNLWKIFCFSIPLECSNDSIKICVNTNS